MFKYHSMQTFIIPMSMDRMKKGLFALMFTCYIVIINKNYKMLGQ